MSDDVVRGTLIDETPDGRVIISAPMGDRLRHERREVKEYWVQPIDSRKLSDAQRRTCYSLMGSIAEWMGDTPDGVKWTMKLDFQSRNIDLIGDRLFSLSNAPMSLIAEFQRYLVAFVVENGVPCKIPLWKFVDDIGDYLWQCMIYKKCAVCGKPAELHHVDRVGMGRNRDEIIHEGMEALPLCRIHHTEAHDTPNSEFMSKYHFDAGVTLDRTLCRIWKLKGARNRE